MLRHTSDIDRYVRIRKFGEVLQIEYLEKWQKIESLYYYKIDTGDVVLMYKPKSFNANFSVVKKTGKSFIGTELRFQDLLDINSTATEM